MVYYILVSCLVLHIYAIVNIVSFVLCKLRRSHKLSACTRRRCPHASVCEASAISILNHASDILDKNETVVDGK